MTQAPIIEARELHTYYGASHILHGVDFSVRAGEAIGLMGRNGMGKTTLIRTLVGHVPPRSGEVRINGRVMTNTAPYVIARQGIAYVPEGRSIFSEPHCQRKSVDGGARRRQWPARMDVQSCS